MLLVPARNPNMKLLFFFFVFTFSKSASAFCREEYEETICENLTFGNDLILNISASKKLTLKHATGRIITENFVKSSNVKELSIIESKIEQIEAGAFCCAPNLKSLKIVNNTKFPKITEKVLQDCTNLKKLTLDGVEIAAGAFKDAKSLKNLVINSSMIGELKKELFNGLQLLNSLTIRHSHCRFIEENAFDKLINLRFLDLQSNGIEAIAPTAFRELPQLKVLNLADNKLRNLTWNEFDELISLKVLFLERNSFNNVDLDKLVAGAPNLERIFFSYDKLTPESRRKVEEKLEKFNVTIIYAGKP